jgi:SNF2 family DNA or RNA helicase
VPPVVTRVGDVLRINISDCRGYEFMDAKDKIKEISGRRWDPETKDWLVPATPDNADRLFRTIGPADNPELTQWIADSKAQATEDLTTPLPDDAELLVPWATVSCDWQPDVVNDEDFKGLLPYQRAAVDLMVDEERIILGDDMGLGKTLTALSAIEEWKLRHPREDGLPHTQPVLVIAPASVTGSWEREIKRWLPPETPIVRIEGSWEKKKRDRLLNEGIDAGAYIIINWEQLRIEKKRVKVKGGGERTVKVMKQPLFETTEWLAVVADEVHKAKSPTSLQSIGLRRIQARVMYGLTGTALMNSPDELWAILAWLYPQDFHERGAAHSPGALAYWPFYMEFVEFYEDHNERKVITGVRNPDALRFLLRKRLIRRTADILGLKGRKRIYYAIDLNPAQRKLYDEAEKAMWLQVVADAKAGSSEALTFIENVAAGNMLRIPNGGARFVRLRQIVESPALIGGDDDSAVLDDAVEKIVDSRPEPWIVFTEFKETTYILQRRLEKEGLKVEVFNGDVAPTDRTKIEDAFQRGEVDVIVGTIKAMYQGVTFTRSNRQHWVSRDVVPDINEQGEAREDRLGQQRRVTVFIPQATDTVASDKVEAINRLKEGIVRSVLPKIEIEQEIIA